MASGYSVMDALNRNTKAGGDDAPRARFRTRDIPINKMYRNSMNFYSLEDVEELAGDILLFGLKQNLELVYSPCEKGEYRIIAGERRWMALKLLVTQGHKQFEVATCKLTAPQDEDEEQVEIIIANAYRSKTNADLLAEEQRLKAALERMRAAGKKIKGYDLSKGRLRDVIASMLRMSTGKIGKIEMINNNLIPEFLERIRKETLTFSAAYELSKLPTEMQKEIAEKYVEDSIPFKKVREMNPDNKKPEEVSHRDTPAVPGQQVPGEVKPEELPEEHTSARERQEFAPLPEKEKPEKTEEQIYSEEQDRIDKQTAKKLQEREDEEKLNHLPSSQERKVHQIRIAAMNYNDIRDGILTFQILEMKKEKYKTGDLLEMLEFAGGRHTGRVIRAEIAYLLEQYTGIVEGYCVLGIKVREENEKS